MEELFIAAFIGYVLTLTRESPVDRRFHNNHIIRFFHSLIVLEAIAMSTLLHSSNLLRNCFRTDKITVRNAFNKYKHYVKYNPQEKYNRITASKEAVLKEMIDQKPTLNPAAWKQIKEDAFKLNHHRVKNFDDNNIDSKILKNCDSLAKALSFVDYLKVEGIEPGIVAKMYLLNIYREEIELARPKASECDTSIVEL